jgi:5-methylthioadenosine/S-adenosylhomocysteine deaminase
VARRILGHDIPKLRSELEASRDYVFAAAGIAQDLFRAHRSN